MSRGTEGLRDLKAQRPANCPELEAQRPRDPVVHNHRDPEAQKRKKKGG
jgi:hypothetical protein